MCSSISWCVLLSVFLCAQADFLSGPIYAVLGADSQYSDKDAAAGVRAVAIDLWWKKWQPTATTIDTDYITYVKNEIAAFHAKGLEVSLGFGFHITPPWVLSSPGAGFTDQFGNTVSAVNFVFSQSQRVLARAYIESVYEHLGGNFQMRIGTQPNAGEFLYPYSKQANGFWAFDNNAQTGADRPKTVPANPYPGWKPGQTTFNGQPFTPGMAENWYNWYVKCMTQTGNWLQGTYSDVGFVGKSEWLMPGFGMVPQNVADYAAVLLSSTDSYLSGNGVIANAWHLHAAGISNKTYARLQCTSMADKSGVPLYNNCTATDRNIALSNNGAYHHWSSARWIAYLADTNGIEKSGENPASGISLTTMTTVAGLIWSCGYERWYYATEANLNANTAAGVAHLSDYAHEMKVYAPLWLNSTAYVGCQVDSTTSRTLSYEAPDLPSTMTNEKCRYHCALRGFTYAGTEYTKQCFCGNSQGAHGTAPASDCKYNCPGNTLEKCGGDSRLSVYKAGTAGHVGCFFDDQRSRDLPFQAYTGSSNTPDTCRTKCMQSGYMYAGLQYGSECWCGNSYGSHGGALGSDCNMACSGDSTIKCGAANRNSIFTSQIPGGYDLYK